MPPPGIGGWFDEFCGIYEALGAQGIGPREADALELWEVGALMGCHRPPEETAGGGTAERNLVAERLAYARGEGPKPEPDRPAPLDPGVTSLIRRIP